MDNELGVLILELILLELDVYFTSRLRQSTRYSRRSFSLSAVWWYKQESFWSMALLFSHVLIRLRHIYSMT